MRYILTFTFLFTGLLAHGKFENHLHFLNSLHMGDFLLLLISLIASVSIYKYFKKETI
jgi:hypothetical protein